jgi:DNA-directed RNA polymerase subunit RPC12/RpoP
MELVCHNCGNSIEVENVPKEYVCKKCGAVNVVLQRSELYGEALGCIPPTSFEWTLPAGVMVDAVGRKTYVTAQGSYLTKEEYIRDFGFDPDIAIAYRDAHKGVRKA